VATVRSQLLPVNLLFVLDRSDSMNCNPPPTTHSQTCENEPGRADISVPSKWEITQQALVEALGQLPSTSKVGLSYFSADDACAVSATPDVPLAALDSGQLSALKTSLAGVVPKGGTPLVGATILAYQHLHTLALANAISGNSFVVLLTDGQQSDQCSDGPRCGDARECTALLTDREAPKAAGPGVGIRTFVIGAPGSEPARTALSQLASRGGTAAPGCDADAGACHFDMTQQSDFATALTLALTAINGRALTCELPLPTADGVQLDLDLVNVLHIPGDGTQTRVIPRDFRAACEQGTEGWRYSRDLARIELCSATCGKLRADEAARLDVVVGCPAAQPI
jgi:hypothetical protein